MSIGLATKGMITQSNFQTFPTPAKIADAVWEELRTDHEVTDTMGGNQKLIRAILSNRLAVDPDTSLMHVYDDDGTTILYTWPVTDRDGRPVSLEAGPPVNRDERTL